MSELTNKAIAHITEQMMEQDNPAIVAIEEHLTELCTTEAVAHKLLADGKRLSNALKAIEKEARKRAVGGCGCVPSDEGFRIVEDYYGITETDKRSSLCKSTAPLIDISQFL